MTFDVDDVARRLAFALRRFTGADLPPSPGGYADAKARAVTQYAALIADAYAAGALTETEMRREIDEIENMTRRYAGTLRGLAGAAAQAAAATAVSVVFGALRAGLSLAGAPLPETLSARMTRMTETPRTA